MLPKEHRLARSLDFERVYRRGQKIRTANLLISFFRTKNEAVRLGFIVSKKINTKANRRNYIKRVLRVVFKQLPKELSFSYDVIVTLLKDPIIKDSAQENLQSILTRDKEFFLREFNVKNNIYKPH